MSQYLRDEILKNLTISKTTLENLNRAITQIAVKANEGIVPKNDNGEINPKTALWKYVIRFDRKGFEVYTFDEALGYFTTAKKVERFCFFVDTLEGRQNNPRGKKIDLVFDTLNPNNCYLRVQDDDKTWADCTFLRLEEEIKRHGNKSWIFRNAWTETLTQLALALGLFLISLWAAIAIAPKLRIPYAPMFVFLAIFIIFSHLWNLIIRGPLLLREIFFPNISFKDPAPLHWLVQWTIGTGLIYLLGKASYRIMARVWISLKMHIQ